MGTHGYRRGTRHIFSRKFRRKGLIPLSTYLRSYKVGDYVDIKVNGAVHKGMPFKFYHGRTGRVYNVAKRAVGIIVSKQVRNRIINKRINVRIEHIRPSRCQEDFLNRVKENKRLQAEAKEKGVKLPKGALKRQPVQPRAGHLVKTRGIKIQDLEPVKYEFFG